MQSHLDVKKAERREQMAQDEPRVYSLDAQLHIDEQIFQQALMSYADRIEAENRMNVASILREGKTELHHNRWTFTVQGELQENLMMRETELVPFLREYIQLPELFVELKVAKEQIAQQDQIPYTDEEKLREMGKKNPVLAKFQEIFKTRIIYR